MTKNGSSQNYFGMRGRGLPRQWALPLEILSTCTCYSWLHWRWFGYVSPSYCITWPSLVLAHFRFLLDHMPFPCCSIGQFSTSTRVVLPLDHVSLLYWTTCRIFIRPCLRFLFDHASLRCPSTCHIFIGPHVHFLFDHVSRYYLSMCRIFIHPCGLTISFHVSNF